ncbi:MAG: response regulator [Oscillospiraceae bacterium]
MKTIIVDDDILGMRGFEIECGTMPDIQLVGKFTLPSDALEYARRNTVEFALLDIDLPEMNGFELCDELRKLYAEIIIVFVTAHSDYAVQAIRKKADYIVFKPYGKEEIENILSLAFMLKGRLKKRLYCRTFGRFDIFIDGNPVAFKSAKAKEILALCVFRQGAPVSIEEIIDKLWEDYNGAPGDCSKFRTALKSLVDTLKQYGCDEVIFRNRGSCYINKSAIDSDYYDFLNDDPKAVCEFQGEFMSDYTWSSTAVYSLSEKKQRYEASAFGGAVTV